MVQYEYLAGDRAGNRRNKAMTVEKAGALW